jgi:hypothetical protein
MEIYDLMTRRKQSLANLVRKYDLNVVLTYVSDDELFRLVDFALAADAPNSDDLERILALGSSAWRVGRRGAHAGLEKRVLDGVREAVEVPMSTEGHAGELLSEAWLATFGLNPDYEKAYSKAVKAVEAAAVPVVSPSNSKATLGSVIASMQNQKDWDLDMTRSAKTTSADSVVLTMARQLWSGQNDRHAGQTDYSPSTKADAEGALFLAAPLVHWFSTRAIARRAAAQ